MKPYVGMPVKIVRGFSVGSRGKIVALLDNKGDDVFCYDVMVLRNGASSPVGYKLNEITTDEPPPVPQIHLATAQSVEAGYVELTAVIDHRTQVFRIKRQTAASMVGAITRALADNIELDVVSEL